jgi:pyruvate carboxylase subunit B
MSPVSGGTGSPDVVTMWHALRGLDYTLDIDIQKVIRAEEVFNDCMKDYFLPPEAIKVDPRTPFAPMPGGALTANTQMMRDAGILHRYEEVFKNMGECVRLGGFGTSVTPVSQFYFQQAFNNTIIGPWKRFAEGYGKMVLGYFGRTPLPPNEEIVKLAAQQLGLAPTDKTVLEINDADPGKGRKAAEAALGKAGLAINDENVFIAAACGEKGIQFLSGQATLSVRKTGQAAETPAQNPSIPAPASQELEITVDEHKFKVRLDPGNNFALVNGQKYKIAIKPGPTPAAVPTPAAAPAPAAPALVTSARVDEENPEQVLSPFPAVVLRVLVQEGQKVEAGQALFIVEAMKMETEVSARKGGRVAIKTQAGSKVQTGQTLAEII